jgi:hypothetical protein
MTITDFIAARLDAKAWSAQAAKDGAQKRTHYRASMIEHCDRELREVAAMRAIVDEVFRYEAKIDSEWGCNHSADQIRRGECSDRPGDIPALRLIAAIDRDHPDFDPAWAPETAEAR